MNRYYGTFPMQSESVKPKVERATLPVTDFWTFKMFGYIVLFWKEQKVTINKKSLQNFFYPT
jgi:hypothetical protein